MPVFLKVLLALPFAVAAAIVVVIMSYLLVPLLLVVTVGSVLYVVFKAAKEIKDE